MVKFGRKQGKSFSIEEIEKMFIESGKTQEELAKQFRVTPQAISYWKKSCRIPYKYVNLLENNQLNLSQLVNLIEKMGWKVLLTRQK